jgi:hypothetical protein
MSAWMLETMNFESFWKQHTSRLMLILVFKDTKQHLLGAILCLSQDWNPGVRPCTKVVYELIQC